MHKYIYHQRSSSGFKFQNKSFGLALQDFGEIVDAYYANKSLRIFAFCLCIRDAFRKIFKILLIKIFATLATDFYPMCDGIIMER